MTLGDLIGVLGGVAGIGTTLGLIIRALSRRGPDKAEASEDVARAAALLVTPLEERITKLAADLENAKTTIVKMQADNQAMKTKLDEYSGGVIVLIAQLEENGLTPRWKPKPKTGPLGQAAPRSR